MNKLSLMVSMLAVIFTAGYGHGGDRCVRSPRPQARPHNRVEVSYQTQRGCNNRYRDDCPQVVVTRAQCVRGILPQMRVEECAPPPEVRYVRVQYVEQPVVVQYQRVAPRRRCEEPAALRLQIQGQHLGLIVRLGL
jgi:hypothetical protein